MKKLFLPFAFIAVMGMQAQTTIIEEKFEKNNEPIDYNFLPKSNKLVIQKGNVPGIGGGPEETRSLIEFASNAEKRMLVDDVKFMDCNFTETEGGFVGSIYANMGVVNKVQFFSNGKSSKAYDVKTTKYFMYSDNYGFCLSLKNGEFADRLDDKDISFKRLDPFSLKSTDLSIELPDLNRLQGDNSLKKSLGDGSVISKKRGIGYTLNILDNEHFEFVTKVIYKGYKSMTFYRTIYNSEGKRIKDLKYDIDLKGLFLADSYNGGGKMNINGKARLSLDADMYFNNYIIDKNTKSIFIYGLFSKESKEERTGYYIFKFSENGEKLYESINYINNEDFQSKEDTYALYSKPIIVGNKLLFVTGRINPIKSKFYYYNYSFLDIETGKELSSKFVTYEMDGFLAQRNFIDGYHTNKQLKNKVLDMHAFIVYEYNPLVKKYINSVMATRKIVFNGLISAEGFWLIETDNKEYYKVTYFEHN
jgi:hypothetical protein